MHGWVMKMSWRPHGRPTAHEHTNSRAQSRWMQAQQRKNLPHTPPTPMHTRDQHWIRWSPTGLELPQLQTDATNGGTYNSVVACHCQKFVGSRRAATWQLPQKKPHQHAWPSVHWEAVTSANLVGIVHSNLCARLHTNRTYHRASLSGPNSQLWLHAGQRVISQRTG